MGGVLSSFGFNQPFFITLIGIVAMLMLTLALVSDPTASSPTADGGAQEFEGVMQSQPPVFQNHSAQYQLVNKKCCGANSSSHLLLNTPLNHSR